MVITYCDTCGVLVKIEASASPEILCADCRSGHPVEPRKRRDSAMIPLARRPSSGTILRVVQDGLGRN